MRGPLSRHGRRVHLVLVLRGAARVHRDDPGHGEAGAVGVQDGGVGLAVDVRHLAVRAWNIYALLAQIRGW